MSVGGIFGNVQSLTNSLSGGVNTIGRAAADVGAGALGSSAVYWKDSLRPASFRKVRFQVRESELETGRKTAVHEYPFRDGVWVEDLGRAGRRIVVSGFLIGDDCIAQRQALIEASETQDAGELVHPTLGQRLMSLVKFSSQEHWDQGRVFQIHMAFVEQGGRVFPTVGPSTGDAVSSAVGVAAAAAGSDFLATVAGPLKSGLAAAAQAISAAQKWTRTAQNLVSDATNLFHFVQSLPGSFGRLFGSSVAKSNMTGTSIPALIAAGAVARANVATAGANLGGTANALITVTGGVGGVAALNAAVVNHVQASQALANAVGAAAVSPADALRLLSGLVAASPPLPPGLNASIYPVAQVYSVTAANAVAAIAGASSDLFRRSAVIAIAQSSASYQPVSYDDAVSVQTMVSTLIDAEITIAGNQGQDASYAALRSLRAAVVQDLTARGANLAPLMQVVLPMSIPAPVLAQRLYRDATRADELVTEASPIHPAFMPVQFQALAR